MDIKPIKSQADYEAALAEIERLWNAAAGSPESDRLDVLATLVERYEDDSWPIGRVDPIEAIKFHMEQNGLTRKDLAEVFGSASRASEIMNRKRRLTIEMVWKLSTAWNLPAESLIQPYELERAV
jgi:HTH-type transcriptional regulator/antitoxin HigA